ncbi:hypothetical protein HJG60_011592 [Phyllostomus discolor]|uniref:Uncharacterized protein n=1 Tax=Phyllostomus discolor TaxID=89673 RepID=A0A834DXH3_9CHIR|nr:hypothetical protein HJG60_011592 [Phyllostomus discolor]
MSTSHFDQGRKPLSTFFWVNEITGEVTYPPLTAAEPAAPLEHPQENLSVGVLSGLHQGLASPPEPRADSPSPLTASLRYSGSRNSLPPTLTHHRPAEAAARSPSLVSATPITISPPGGALSTLVPCGPAPPPLASAFPSSTSILWAYTCKLRNALIGKN